MNRLQWLLLSFLFLFAAPLKAHALQYYGRATFGAFASSENFQESSAGQTQNDFVTASSRFFIHAKEIGKENWEATLDVRDKFDFFEKLNQELLSLGPENSLQVRRMSVGYPNEKGSYFAELGRFPVIQAGDVHVDGFQIGLRPSEDYRVSLFGGLNPRASDQDYMGFETNAFSGGLYFVAQPKSDNWNRYFYWSNSLAAQNYKGHLDRVFFTQNAIYQWSTPNQVMMMSSVDFVPNVYLQNGLIEFHQRWLPDWETDATVSAVDVIQYTRNQGLLETLSASPYREARFASDYRIKKIYTLRAIASYGARNVDGLSRTELTVGPLFTRIGDLKISGRVFFGARKNFTSTDQFMRGGLGYSSRFWDFDVDAESGLRREGDGNVFHPTTLDLGVTRQFTRELFASAYFQKAGTEAVDIWSFSAKVGFRLGSQPLPPLRDGSAPRGRL